MTKLEEKLLELGYERVRLQFSNISIYNKIGKHALFVIKILENEIFDYHLHKNIHNQNDIDNLQQAFNEMQKDLEVLKDYEN